MKPAIVLFAVVAATGCKKDQDDGQAQTDETETRPAAEEPAKAGPPTLDAEAIAKAAGTEASETDDGVIRIGWVRDDVPVQVDGARLPPPAGLGSWAAFQATEDGARVMGDTVVFQDEITPAIDAAFSGGLRVTALHNHFVFDQPPVYFMHIGGSGDPEQLARAVADMWNSIRSVRAKNEAPKDAFPGEPVEPGELDAAALEEIIGHAPAEKPGGVLKVAIPRTATMGDAEFGGSMGLSTWAAFTGDMKHASIDGDFAMTAAEVQPVLHALRDADIHVVALHNHMIDETPAYYFVHYWGKGKATDLARGFKSALGAQNGDGL